MSIGEGYILLFADTIIILKVIERRRLNSETEEGPMMVSMVVLEKGFYKIVVASRKCDGTRSGGLATDKVILSISLPIGIMVSPYHDLLKVTSKATISHIR